MRILVAVASKHGGTKEIASRIGTRLEAHGHEVRTVAITHNTDVRGYDAYVIGSAVYAGRWMKEARQFLRDHAGELRVRPTWLFGSGPVGERAEPSNGVDHPEEMTTLVRARDHHVFAGRMFRSELGPLERLVAGAVHAPDGDFRDWDDVDDWAHTIIAELDDHEAEPPRAATA